MLLFDTDVLIWVQRGNERAARLIDETPTRFIAVQTYMELLQCAENKQQQKLIKEYLSELNFNVLPLTQNIGHRASIYIEDYSLSTGMRTGDAIIAATAVENNLPLCSGNQKHFRKIVSIQLISFRP